MEMESMVKIKVAELSQFVNKEIFVGQLGIEDLNDIVKYTNRTSNPNDPFVKEDSVDLQYQYYQRIKNADRSYDIKLFFLRNIWHMFYYEKMRISPLGTFPSSIILAINSFETNSIEEYALYLKKEEVPDLAFLSYKNEKNSNFKEPTIQIPRTSQALIVDGQHRIAGLQLLLEEALKGEIEIKKANKKDYYTQLNGIPYDYIVKKIKDFKFIVSFLIDFDLFEQSEIFVTVNFNQQKVNKSFYYDIFGTATSSRAIEKLLHDITSHMNYKEDSPLYKKIKMLGTGNGFFSQAFFVDAFLPHFKNGFLKFVNDDYQSNGKDYKLVINFFKAYFKSVFSIYQSYLPETSKKYENVLLKTTGMGALIKLMPLIFNKIKLSNKISNSFEVLKLDNITLEKYIIEILDPVKDSGYKYFDKESEFSKGSGKGLQAKLFERISDDLGFNKKIDTGIDMPVI